MTNIAGDVAGYYAGKLAAHGATPAGVDWSSESSQMLRIDQLLSVIDKDEGSLLDVGCGYGAAVQPLAARHPRIEYTGYDIAPGMIDAARVRNGDQGTFVMQLPEGQRWDWAIASGIFNVRLSHGDDDWLTHIHATLDLIDEHSSRGFSFNVLTAYADADRMRPDLYYADPLALFDRCKRKYSPFVRLLHDYPLYEFTIVVRKTQQ